MSLKLEVVNWKKEVNVALHDLVVFCTCIALCLTVTDNLVLILWFYVIPTTITSTIMFCLQGLTEAKVIVFTVATRGFCVA